MATLDFKGPFHWEHLQQLKPYLTGKSGIYIWGFMFGYNKQTKEILEPVNYNSIEVPMFEQGGIDYQTLDWFYIPYYVGLDNNMNTNPVPFQRIVSEHSVRCGDAAKFTRLYDSFYKSFFNDSSFPTNTGQKKPWILNNKSFNAKISSCVEFFNNFDIISNKLYPGQSIFTNPLLAKITDCPITNVYKNNKVLNDSLYEIVDPLLMNNFWFCYAELPDGVIANEDMEAQTFYSLKGKTISKTKNFKDVHVIHDIIPEKTCEDIFKMYNSKAYISNQFKGYMKHFNQLTAQLKDSKLTVKYSEANDGELACIWEDNSDDESLLVINRIKIDAAKLNEHVPDDRERLVNQFFEPEVMNNSIYERLMDILDEGNYQLMDAFVHRKRGQTVSTKFGF